MKTTRVSIPNNTRENYVSLSVLDDLWSEGRELLKFFTLPMRHFQRRPESVRPVSTVLPGPMVKQGLLDRNYLAPVAGKIIVSQTICGSLFICEL